MTGFDRTGTYKTGQPPQSGTTPSTISGRIHVLIALLHLHPHSVFCPLPPALGWPPGGRGRRQPSRGLHPGSEEPPRARAGTRLQPHRRAQIACMGPLSGAPTAHPGTPQPALSHARLPTRAHEAKPRPATRARAHDSLGRTSVTRAAHVAPARVARGVRAAGPGPPSRWTRGLPPSTRTRQARSAAVQRPAAKMLPGHTASHTRAGATNNPRCRAECQYSRDRAPAAAGRARNKCTRPPTSDSAGQPLAP